MSLRYKNVFVILWLHVDLHGLGALSGADKTLFFFYQPLKGNPCVEKQKSYVWSIDGQKDFDKIIIFITESYAVVLLAVARKL